jgi:hypothetical protein
MFCKKGDCHVRTRCKETAAAARRTGKAEIRHGAFGRGRYCAAVITVLGVCGRLLTSHTDAASSANCAEQDPGVELEGGSHLAVGN